MPEAWEWVRIQTDTCPFCGFGPGSVPVERFGGLALDEAADWRLLLETAEPASLRRHPAPGVWSPLEYGAHVRDMLVVFGARVARAAIEDDPLFAWSEHDPDGVYNQLDPQAVAGEIEVEAERFAQILGERSTADWACTARRGGPAGHEESVDHFTTAGLACFGLHEVHHHRLDAARALSQRPGLA